MFTSKLFLGMAVNKSFAARLDQVNPDLVALFLDPRNGYLRSMDREGKRYLGKMVEPSSDLASLELLEANIISLLKKIVPEFTYDQVELELFPLVTKE